MDPMQPSLGFDRRISYSFFGLLAGDVAMLVVVSLITLLWEQNPLQTVGTFPFLMTCSLFAWVVVGIPAVLLTNASFVARSNWLSVIWIGALLGSIALVLTLSIVGHRAAGNLEGVGYYWMLAVLVSSIACAVYRALVRQTLRRQKEDSTLMSGIELPLDIYKSEDAADSYKSDPPLDIYKSDYKPR
jgi:hypothetical protein